MPKNQLGWFNLPQLGYVTFDKDFRTPSSDYAVRSIRKREETKKENNWRKDALRREWKTPRDRLRTAGLGSKRCDKGELCGTYGARGDAEVYSIT